jgi:hypothetical protein
MVAMWNSRQHVGTGTAAAALQRGTRTASVLVGLEARAHAQATGGAAVYCMSGASWQDARGNWANPFRVTPSQVGQAPDRMIGTVGTVGSWHTVTLIKVIVYNRFS